MYEPVELGIGMGGTGGRKQCGWGKDQWYWVKEPVELGLKAKEVGTSGTRFRNQWDWG